MYRGFVKAAAGIILAVVLVTGCETVGETVKSNPKTTIGAAGGATVGGLIAAAAGGNPAAIAASVIGGLLVEDVRGTMTPTVFTAMNRAGDGKFRLHELLNALFQDFDAMDTDRQGSITMEQIDAYVRSASP